MNDPCYTLACAAAAGVQGGGGIATIKRVPEIKSAEELREMNAEQYQSSFMNHVSIATVEELPNYDGFIFVVASRLGLMPAEMKSFLDATGALWVKNSLVGKVGSVVCASEYQHDGNEATILSFHTCLLHHGMVLVGLPYSFRGQMGTEEVKGGSPYGATTVFGNRREPSQGDLDGVRFQAQHVTQIAAKLRM